jgi:hypothetical protein
VTLARIGAMDKAILLGSIPNFCSVAVSAAESWLWKLLLASWLDGATIEGSATELVLNGETPLS